jgi:hypothetical protein
VTRNDAALVAAGWKTLEVVVLQPGRDEPACSNKKLISIPKHVGARWLPDLPCPSDEWSAICSPERNQIEGKDGEAKNSLLGSLKEPGYRRMIGMALQLVAILARTIATTILSVLSFLTKVDAPEQKPGFTPLSPYGHKWWTSKYDSHQPHRIAGRRLAKINDHPPKRPTAVPDIPQVAQHRSPPQAGREACGPTHASRKPPPDLRSNSTEDLLQRLRQVRAGHPRPQTAP